MRRGCRFGSVRRAGIHQNQTAVQPPCGRFRIHRKIDRTPFRKDASRGDRPRFHRNRPGQRRRDESRPRRIGLYGGHPRIDAESVRAGDMDGRGRLYDRRPEGYQRCVRDRTPELRRSDGAMQFRSEGDLSADDLPGLPQKYSDRDSQYVQPGFERHGHFPGVVGGCQPGYQRDLVDQRHLPDHDPGLGHGRRYRRQLPDFQNARQIGNQRIPRLAGGVRKYDLDRRAQRRRGSRDGSAD